MPTLDLLLRIKLKQARDEAFSNRVKICKGGIRGTNIL